MQLEAYNPHSVTNLCSPSRTRRTKAPRQSSRSLQLVAPLAEKQLHFTFVDDRQTLPFQKVVHQVSTLDAQPSNQGGILVMVTGALLVSLRNWNRLISETSVISITNHKLAVDL